MEVSHILKQLEEEIEQLREEMVQLALHLGMNHPDVHACSRRLDALLLEWHKLKGDIIKEGQMVYRIERIHSPIQEKTVALSFV